MPQTRLRILFIEASDDDLQQVLTHLAAHNFQTDHMHVDNAQAMQSALLEHTWDVVLCSYNPPAFGGLEALTLMQSLEQDIPFLFLSHNLREENIIQAIQSGAGDYIYKGNLNRLVPAIRHYLQETAIRNEHRKMLQELKENQTRLHTLISNLPGMAYQILQQENRKVLFPYVSDGCKTLLGISAHELRETPPIFFKLLHPDDINTYQAAMQHSQNTMDPVYWEGRIKSRPDDRLKWVNLRCSPRKLSQGIQWECVMLDITERKQAEIDTLDSQNQLRELSAHIQDVREQERLALAREVHDDMGSMLTAMKLDLAWISNRLGTEGDMGDKIRDIENLVSRCALAASNICRNLRPSALDSFGVIPAIEIEVSEFEKRTGIHCQIDTVDEDVAVDPNIAITVFRILQETLNNIAKHAHASNIKISVYNRHNEISLIVGDNGTGLTEKDRSKPRSFGLRGIQERVSRFGGEVSIISKPGKGTTVSVSIPQARTLDSSSQKHQQTLF